MGNEHGLFSVAITLLQPVQNLLILAALASLRLTAAFALLPPMGETFLRGFTRQGFITIIALFIAFGVPVSAVEGLGFYELLAHGGKEVVIGLMMGFAGAQVFWIAQSVGAYIDTQSGFNNVQLTNPLSGQQSTPVSDLLLNVVVVVFFSMGGMLVFLGAVFDSFHVWPLLAPLPDWQKVGDLFAADQTQSMMAGVVKFAAPMLIVLMLIDLGFGLVTRSASKLEVSSLSQPVKGAVTVLMLALMIATLVDQVHDLLLPTGLLAQLKAAMGVKP